MDAAAGRGRMVDALVEQGLLRDPRVEAAMRDVPREAFVGEEPFLDAPQPIGAGQTISAPHMVAIMAQALDVRPGHRVLEVGAGSGYHAAILARLCAPGRIVCVEVVPELAHRARATLRDVGVDNAEIVTGDGSLGYSPRAPYDRISVAAGAPRVPAPLLDQLAPAGLLVIPVGGPAEQTLVRVDARGNVESLMPVRFVPLVGAHGWRA